MKHALKVTAVIISVLILIVGGLCAFAFGAFDWSPEAVYYRFFYPKDRIEARVQVTIDGEEQRLDESAVHCFYDVDGTKEEPLDVTAQGYALQVSTPAGAYGIYRLCFSVQTYAFELELVHFNWWDVCDYEIDIAVDTRKQTVTLKGSYTDLDESAKQKEQTLYATQAAEAQNRFYLG